jgi:hypothetical protein
MEDSGGGAAADGDAAAAAAPPAAAAGPNLSFSWVGEPRAHEGCYVFYDSFRFCDKLYR